MQELCDEVAMLQLSEELVCLWVHDAAHIAYRLATARDVHVLLDKVRP
jgi:hypothetical protein